MKAEIKTGLKFTTIYKSIRSFLKIRDERVTVDFKDFSHLLNDQSFVLELFSIPINMTQIVCGEVSWRIRRETPVPLLHDISSPNVENFQLEPHLSNTSHRFSGISFPFLKSFRQILGGTTSSAVSGEFSRSTILSSLPSSFLPATLGTRSDSRGNSQLSYFLFFFFFYLSLAKGNGVTASEANTCYIPFEYSVSPVHPFIGKLSSRFTSKSLRANFPRSLRYLSKVNKYIILWIIILIL